MLSPTTDRFRDDAPSVHQAARFGLVMGSVGVGFMVLAAVWVRHCSGYDTAACSMPYRTVLALAGPLFLFGSGPVRGFAVTLGLGIVTSVFTAFFVTRLLVVIWFERRRPKTIEV